jgi:hypothetical protein
MLFSQKSVKRNTKGKAQLVDDPASYRPHKGGPVELKKVLKREKGDSQGELEEKPLLVGR